MRFSKTFSIERHINIGEILLCFPITYNAARGRGEPEIRSGHRNTASEVAGNNVVTCYHTRSIRQMNIVLGILGGI